jgi:hypothetical protein
LVWTLTGIILVLVIGIELKVFSEWE